MRTNVAPVRIANSGASADRVTAAPLCLGVLTTATYFARPLARALRARGLALSALPQERTPYQNVCAIWETAATLAGASIGVEAARHREVGDYGALEYAIRTSTTLRAAFDRLARYHRILNDRARLAFTSQHDLTRVQYLRPSEQPMPPAYVEFVLATWVLMIRELSESPPSPITLLPHPAPPMLHHEIFGEVRFDTGAAELHLANAVLDAPLPRSDSALGVVLDRHVEALLIELKAHGAITRAASLAIERRLPQGTPRLDDVARDLSLSARELRGRMEREHTSFSAVVEDTRRRLATTMVADPALSLGEIAFRLGFSEASAFHRAYRRWHGRTPRER